MVAFIGIFLALAVAIGLGGWGSDDADVTPPSDEDSGATNGDDTLTGGANGDMLDGEGGNDLISGNVEWQRWRRHRQWWRRQ